MMNNPRSQAPSLPVDSSPRLLWNPENVRDVAESLGISVLNEEAQRSLTQDVEFRIGQIVVEALRFMRAANRTVLTVQDVTLALKVLDVHPLYGYDSTRSLRFGEASLGAGQPLYYVEDEEVEFDKLINAPLPKVPRDVTFTAHWLAIEGVQPAIPQNPSSATDSRSDPSAKSTNPALAALAGNDVAPGSHPSIKHIISKELILYFEKVQTALLDDTPDEEVARLREAALASVREDPGLHQLVPYFVNYIANQVSHHLDDLFVLRQMMELTAALIANESLFLDPYASPLASAVLTCLLARKLGTTSNTSLSLSSAYSAQPPPSTSSTLINAFASDSNTHPSTRQELEIQRLQYQLREFSASLLGRIAKKYATSNHLLRPKITRTCLKYFLDPTKPLPVLYGAISGLLAGGGTEAIRILVLKNVKEVSAGILEPLMEQEDTNKLDVEVFIGGLVRAITSIASTPGLTAAAAAGGGELMLDPLATSLNGTALTKKPADEDEDMMNVDDAASGPVPAPGRDVVSEGQMAELVEFLGPIIGPRVAQLKKTQLVTEVLEARFLD